MPLKLVLIGALVLVVWATSAAACARERGRMALIQLLGACGLATMVFAHACERFGWLRSLGWGRPGTVGHYVDLVGAIGGVVLLALGYGGRRMARSRRPIAH